MIGALPRTHPRSAGSTGVAGPDPARRRLEAELRRQNAYLNALHETSLALLNRRDVGDLLQQIVLHATSLVDAERGLVNVVEPGNDTLTTVAEVGGVAGRVGMHIRRGEGVAGRAWADGRTVAVADYRSSPERLDVNGDVLPAVVAGVPLVVGAEVAGVLVVARNDGGPAFSSDEITLLERFAQLAALSLDNAGLLSSARSELLSRERAEARVRLQASLLDEVRNAVIAVDTAGLVTYWNRHAEQLFGWTASETFGRPLDEFAMPEVDEEGVRARLRIVAAAGSWEGASRIRRRDGSILSILTSLAPLCGPDGALQGIVGVSADITELERARSTAVIQARRQSLVAQFGRHAQGGHEPDELMRRAAELVSEELNVSHCSIFELMPEDGRLHLVAFRGWEHDVVGAVVDPATGDTLGARALRSDQACEVHDALEESGPHVTAMRGSGVRAGLGVALHGALAPFGALCVYSPEPRVFAQNEIDFLQSIGNVLAMSVERRRAEDLLRAREQRFRALIEGGTDVVLLFDRRGRISYASPSVTRVLGYEPDELIGRVGMELVPPEDRGARRTSLSELMKLPGAATPSTFRYLHKAGTWRRLEGVARNLLHDPAVQAIVVNCRDVTDRVNAEQALRASEEHFRSLVQNAADIIAVIDSDGGFRYVSPAVERVLGYAPEALIGRRKLGLVHPDDIDAMRRAIAETRNGSSERSEFECRLRHADGSWRFIQITLSGGGAADGGCIVNARDVTERRQFEQQLRQRAFSDELTGLPNRALLMDRLEHGLSRCARSGQPLALLFLDLDRFKLVNDGLGHALGDELLVSAARRLLACVRPGDTVSRFGGDEFVILLEDGTSPDGAEAVAERVIAEFRAPFTLAGHDVYVGTSVGVIVAAGSCSAADVLRDADVALYRAKQAGRGRWMLFEPAMNARAVERLGLETDLRRALERRELELEFQPVVDLRSGMITRAEALLRWRHPVHGALSPDEFIPIAEETGLIVPIGRWALEQSCLLAAAWPDGPGGPLSVAVNLSAREFGQNDLVDQVRDALASAGLAPGRLQLEIAESVIMQAVEETLLALQRLKALGVQLAIDDFGTGYSSLSYLRRFPVSTLKVDRSFVLELHHSHEAAAIVQSVVALAHALGLQVTAEGIETERHLTRALALGCDRGQGFYLARPLAAAAFAELIRRGGRAVPAAA